jgi:hypothetical protein
MKLNFIQIEVMPIITQKAPNRLAKETLSYLLQHVKNQVNWFPL